MAEAVNTILSTIGQSERLDTRTAERVVSEEARRAEETAQDLVKRQRQQLDDIQQLESTDLPPTMQNTLNKRVEELKDKIRSGGIGEQEINFMVSDIKGEYAQMKSAYDTYAKPFLTDYYANPEAKISIDANGNEVTEKIIGETRDALFDPNREWSMDDMEQVYASMQAAQNYEEVDGEQLRKDIEMYYEQNKDSLQNKYEDVGQFFKLTTQGGIQPEERGRLAAYLREKNATQLNKMAARRGISPDAYIDSFLPQAQQTEELQIDKADEEVRSAVGKQRLETPNYAISVGNANERDTELAALGLPVDKPIVALSRTLKKGKEIDQTLMGTKGTFGRLLYNPNTGIINFSFVPKESTTIKVRDIAKGDDGKPKTSNGKPVFTGKEISKTVKTGEPIDVYVDPSSGLNVDMLGQLAESTGISLEELYKAIGYTNNQQNEAAEDADLDSLVDDIINEL